MVAASVGIQIERSMNTALCKSRRKGDIPGSRRVQYYYHELTSHIQTEAGRLRITRTTSQGGEPPGNPHQTTARNSQSLLLWSTLYERSTLTPTHVATGLGAVISHS